VGADRYVPLARAEAAAAGDDSRRVGEESRGGRSSAVRDLAEGEGGEDYDDDDDDADGDGDAVDAVDHADDDGGERGGGGGGVLPQPLVLLGSAVLWHCPGEVCTVVSILCTSERLCKVRR
jgi:hypothetical protein